MAVPGTIVEYIEQGRFYCGLVLEDHGRRLRLLVQNGREVNLPAARAMHVGRRPWPGESSREARLQHLKAVDEQRRRLAEEVDLEAIWQLASEEDQERFAPEFLAALAFGEEVDDDRVAAFLRRVISDKLFFKYKEGQVVVHSPETVDRLREQREKERQRQALLEQGAAALARLAREGVCPPDWAQTERQRCLRLIGDFYLFGNEAEESGLARELLKKAGLTRPHAVYELLVTAGVWRPDENLPLRRYGLPAAFSDELLAEAAVVEPSVEELLAEGRRDLRHLKLLTIDGSTTRDFDDALHLEVQGENLLVGIHIADVSRWVRPGSALFAEAARRITSIYFDDDQVPMLPPSLSEGVCSLVAGQVRAALSFLVTVGPDGAVRGYEIVPSVVTVARQLEYLEAEQMMAADEELQRLQALSLQLRRRRIEAGALLLPVPDVVVRPGAGGEVAVDLAEVDTPSRALVAECMVLANTVAAEFLAERQVPGLFRAQEEPHQRLISGYDQDLFAIWRQRKQLRPGQLLTRPRPHSGVGAMQYTTVTSPIRRFLDLLMQHQIHGLLQGRGPVFSEQELREFAGLIITTQSRVNQARRERHRYWLLKYLAARQGRMVDALIIGKGPRRVNVVLLDCLLEADLPPNQGMGARPGEVIQVRIARAEPLEGRLRLEW